MGRRLTAIGEGPVLGLVDHRREMGGGQARIERVADVPRAHQRVVHLQMMLGVPAERADADPPRRSPSFVSAPDNRLLRARNSRSDPSRGSPRVRRDDLAIARPLCGMIEKLIDGEGIGLHAARTGT